MRHYVTTRYGDRCLILRHGTRDGAPALVRRERDGREIEVYYEDLASGQGHGTRFYGIHDGGDFNKRLTAKVREMRDAFTWRGWPSTEARGRDERRMPREPYEVLDE